jgi:hypothetical protein
MGMQREARQAAQATTDSGVSCGHPAALVSFLCCSPGSLQRMCACLGGWSNREPSSWRIQVSLQAVNSRKQQQEAPQQ